MTQLARQSDFADRKLRAKLITWLLITWLKVVDMTRLKLTLRVPLKSEVG